MSIPVKIFPALIRQIWFSWGFYGCFYLMLTIKVRFAVYYFIRTYQPLRPYCSLAVTATVINREIMDVKPLQDWVIYTWL